MFYNTALELWTICKSFGSNHRGLSGKRLVTYLVKSYGRQQANGGQHFQKKCCEIKRLSAKAERLFAYTKARGSAFYIFLNFIVIRATSICRMQARTQASGTTAANHFPRLSSPFFLSHWAKFNVCSLAGLL